MRLSGLLAAVALSGVLAGCAGAPEFRQTLRPIYSNGTVLLDPCKPFTDAHHPTRMFQIELQGSTFDVKHIDPKITVLPVTSPPWTSGDANNSAPYTTVPTWSPKTRLDLDLDLFAPASGKHREMVLIKVIVDDHSVAFRNDGFAIMSETGNGQHMFCQFKGGFDKTRENSATFVAYYYSNPDSTHHTFGVFDIGLVIPDSDPQFILPIFIDPEVKNDG